MMFKSNLFTLKGSRLFHSIPEANLLEENQPWKIWEHNHFDQPRFRGSAGWAVSLGLLECPASKLPLRVGPETLKEVLSKNSPIHKSEELGQYNLADNSPVSISTSEIILAFHLQTGQYSTK